MSNGALILNTLDQYLDTDVELTLYGRAALQLGFADPVPEFAQSRDVDAVFWVGQAHELAASGNFWEAVDQANELLADQELYISHFFQEDQVILTSDWIRNRIPIPGNWRHLRIFRLGDEDLLLTKLMRNDPIDQADAHFIVSASGLKREQIKEISSRARIPDIPEVHEEFHKSLETLLQALRP